MSLDISHILEDWPFEPGKVTARRVRGDDGRDKIQLRLDTWKRTRIEVWYQGKFIGLARKAPLHFNAENGGEQAYDR